MSCQLRWSKKESLEHIAADLEEEAQARLCYLLIAYQSLSHFVI